MAALPALAATPGELLAGYAAQARRADPAASPSAARGAQFFTRAPREWSCASCHTRDPRADGRHVVTGKSIRPLAPVANPARFTDAARVEKWFHRNCGDVLGRECTPAEKADLIAYLNSLTPEA
ncbi:MAG: DUF1924 domain-containing protein [Proteobacteria bacterium]|nr:DUF1924 domain-containing protein [Pseudomonadota bacterium]